MESLHMVGLPWGGEITYYAFLLVLGAVCMGMLVFYLAPNHGATTGRGILFVLLSGLLGLFCGRAVYCGVHYEQFFLDAQGKFAVLPACIDPQVGSVNVVGVILGILLAALFAGIGRKKAGLGLLDSAAMPGLLLFAFARVIEPLAGIGHGIPVTDERFARFPFAAENGAGEWLLSVCYIEAALACLILLILFILRFVCKKNGTLAGIALALLCATQIVPDGLRQDGALTFFGFVRVSQAGYLALLIGVFIAMLIRGGRRGLEASAIVVDILILLLGLAVCAGGVYALTYMDWPALYIHCAMIAASLLLGVTAFVRLVKEDRIPG